MKRHAFIAAMALFMTMVMAGNSYALFGFGKFQTVEAENGVVTIPVADVNDGKAHYYVFKKNNHEIKFFLIKSNDGVIRAAFDACDVCFREKKGYDQEGDFMNCNNCGMKFHTSRINVVKGGCNPSPLARVNDGTNVIIKERSIMSGRGYF